MIPIVFMGSGPFACPILDSLLHAPDILLRTIVTQPDRPAGRGRRLAPCPAKALAAPHHTIPILSPHNVNAPEVLARLAPTAPDVLVVTDYAQFIQPHLLALPRLDALNVHPSLLPKYRGAAPIQWTLANGDPTAGVTILRVTPKMDAGPIYAQASLPVLPAETTASLSRRLAALAAPLLLRVIRSLYPHPPSPSPQNHARATFARRLLKSDSLIDWSLPAATIECHIRAFSPWPGTATTLPNGRRLNILQAQPLPAPHAPPGLRLPSPAHQLLIATGTGALRILSLQPAGARPMPTPDFLRGYPLPSNFRFPSPFTPKNNPT